MITEAESFKIIKEVKVTLKANQVIVDFLVLEQKWIKWSL